MEKTIEQLFVHFDRLMQSPESVQRLRRFILDLAVRGKLVPQDPVDEPAAALLQRIAKEKARLVKAGEIKRPKKLPSIDDIPYSLPPSWRWTRIREITSDRGQRAPEAVFTYIDVTSIDKENGEVAGAKVLQVNEAPSRARKVVRKDDVVYSCVRPYLLNVAVVEKDFNPKPIASTAFAVLNGHGLVLPRYIWIVLRSPFVVARVEEDMRGQAYPAINDADFSILPFPLPPLPEQHRIVAKVGELMTDCDRLEAAQAERETTRRRLTASSLARMNAPDSDQQTFREHVAFALNNIVPLTTKPEQVKALRQTILNLAVRGKLVPQDPKDEPAAKLLQRIPKEKTRGRRREQVDIQTESAKNLEDVPANWSLVPLITLGSWAVGSGFPKNEQGRTDGPYFFLKVSDMNLAGNAKFITTANNCIDEDAAKRIRAKIHPTGTIIFPKIGGAIATNKRRILTKGSAIDNNCLGITFSNELNIEWAYLLLASLDFTQYQAGTAVPALSQSTLAKIPVGLPPVAEQNRIVAKVDKLMGLCDRLAESLEAGDDGRGLLAETLLSEALSNVEIAPDDEPDKNGLENVARTHELEVT